MEFHICSKNTVLKWIYTILLSIITTGVNKPPQQGLHRDTFEYGE